MTRFLLHIFILLFAGYAVHGEPGSSWQSWRSSNRDGKSEDKGLLKAWPEGGPEKLWEKNNLGKGFSSVTVADGRVFITGAKNGKCVVYCLDMKGQTLWETEHGAAWTRSYAGSRASVTIDRDKAYLLSGHGKLACYEIESGKMVWSRKMSEFGGKTPNWGYAESALVVNGKVIVSPGGKNCIVALDKKTGRAIWKSRGNGASAHYCSAIRVPYRGKHMIVNGNRGGIFAVSESDGETLWSNGFCSGNTANCPTPAFSDNYVFWANGYGKGGICLKISFSGTEVKATEAWRTKDMVCHHGGYVIHNGYIYGNNNKGWSCLDLKTGEKKWFAKGVGKGSLCYADGMLYLFGERGGNVALAVASPENFEMTGSFSVSGKGPSWAHPVVTGGRLYLRYGNNLYCYNVRK